MRDDHGGPSERAEAPMTPVPFDLVQAFERALETLAVHPAADIPVVAAVLVTGRLLVESHRGRDPEHLFADPPGASSR